ncbi:hypothetical protein GCM10023354_05380 [Garicola koreensis]
MAPDTWRYVRSGQTLQGSSRLYDHASALMDPEGREKPIRDRWRYEELILEDPDNGVPARDVKFYAFYGEIAFGLEIRRDRETQTRHFLPDNNETIFPLTLKRNSFEGLGASKDELASIKRISKAIPAPFMRIDMLRSADGLVLGEFTPKPGTVAHFTPEWDHKMGEMWRHAQARLTNDLLSGAGFQEFKQATCD